MAKFSASEARANFNRVLELAKTEAVEIEKHGKSVVVILDAMKYEKLLDYIEDVEDNLAYLEYKMNPDQEFRTLEEVEAELGLKPIRSKA